MPAARISAVARSENPSRASLPSTGDQSSVAVANEGFRARRRASPSASWARRAWNSRIVSRNDSVPEGRAAARASATMGSSSCNRVRADHARFLAAGTVMPRKAATSA